MVRQCIDRGKFPAERKIVRHGTTQVGISLNLRNEVGWVLRKTAYVRCAVRAWISEDKRCRVTIPLILHHVKVDIQAIGKEDSHASLNLLASTESGWRRALLMP